MKRDTAAAPAAPFDRPARQALPHADRRRWLAHTLSLGLAGLALSGCGFRMRGQYGMAFQTIQLTGFAPTSQLATELARALENTGVRVVGSSLEATRLASSTSVPTSHLVFEALSDTRDMVVSSTTRYGQVRGMTARIKLRFQVRRGDGTVLVPPSDISMSNDLTYNEKDALAKQDESAALQRAMQTDIVNQVLRRLSAITPADLPSPPQPDAAPAVIDLEAEPDRRVPTPRAPARDSAR